MHTLVVLLLKSKCTQWLQFRYLLIKITYSKSSMTKEYCKYLHQGLKSSLQLPTSPPCMELSDAAANFGDHTHHQIWGSNVNNDIYMNIHKVDLKSYSFSTSSNLGNRKWKFWHRNLAIKNTMRPPPPPPLKQKLVSVFLCRNVF